MKESEVALSCLTRCKPMDCSLQAPLSMGFSRQDYWSGLPFPSPGDLPNPGIEHRSPALQADALSSEPPGKPKAYTLMWTCLLAILQEINGTIKNRFGGYTKSVTEVSE